MVGDIGSWPHGLVLTVDVFLMAHVRREDSRSVPQLMPYAAFRAGIKSQLLVELFKRCAIGEEQ